MSNNNICENPEYLSGDQMDPINDPNGQNLPNTQGNVVPGNNNMNPRFQGNNQMNMGQPQGPYGFQGPNVGRMPNQMNNYQNYGNQGTNMTYGNGNFPNQNQMNYPNQVNNMNMNMQGGIGNRGNFGQGYGMPNQRPMNMNQIPGMNFPGNNIMPGTGINPPYMPNNPNMPGNWKQTQQNQFQGYMNPTGNNMGFTGMPSTNVGGINPPNMMMNNNPNKMQGMGNPMMNMPMGMQMNNWQK